MIDELKAFALVAEVGSLQGAAARLFITQSAVSRRIQKLEDDLGVTVLDRSTKPPRLTLAGRQILTQCQVILKAVTELKASTVAGSDPVGPFRIGVTHSLAEGEIADALLAIGQRFQLLSIQVLADWTPGLIEKLQAGTLDVAIILSRGSKLLPAGFSAQKIGIEPLVVVASQRVKHPSNLSAEDVSKIAWILKPNGCAARETLELELGQKGLPLQISAEVLDEDLQLSLIARGLGIGLLPRRLFERHSQRKELRKLKVAGWNFNLSILMVCPLSLGRMKLAADTLSDRLKAKLLLPNRAR